MQYVWIILANILFQLREVYAITLASFVCETESYKVAFELLK